MFETGFCVQFHNIHRLVENSGEGRKRWTQSCQSGISPRRTWLAAIFMRKKGVFMSLDSMDLELVWTCDWYAAYAICSIYQHHPTSIIYIHVPRATFLPYGSYGGLGELALSAIAGPKAYPNTWNWMDRQPRDIGESSPVRCCKMESFSNRIGWQMTYIYQPLLCKTRVLLFALCSQSTSI
jgi:hypothetical protein